MRAMKSKAIMKRHQTSLDRPQVLDVLPSREGTDSSSPSFRSYSEALHQASVLKSEDQTMSPGHYLILLRQHEKRVRRRWCQRTFTLSS